MTRERDPWRDMTTEDLLAEIQCRRWDLASIDATPDAWQYLHESRAFCVHLIRSASAELARRRQLIGKPTAPQWPATEHDRTAELAEIKRRVPIVDLIHREVWRVYERRGAHDVWCCCPLPDHAEDTPSFHFDDAKQVWHCFGCQRGGDVFELARHLWAIGEFHKVAQRLRDLAGIGPPAKPAAVEPQRGPAPLRRLRR